MVEVVLLFGQHIARIHTQANTTAKQHNSYRHCCRYTTTPNTKTMSLYFRSNPPLFLPFLVIFLSLFLFTRQTSASPHHSHFHTVVPIPGIFLIIFFNLIYCSYFEKIAFCFFFLVLQKFPFLMVGLYTYVEREYGGVSLWKLKRYLAEEPTDNSTLILAEKRTQRKDPIDNFHKYKGGWNISNKHYWAVSFSHLCQC